MMARLTKKQQQDKRELLSSSNHVNNCIGSTHAAENRKFLLEELDRIGQNLKGTCIRMCCVCISWGGQWPLVIHLVVGIEATDFSVCQSFCTVKVVQNENDISSISLR